MGPPLQDEPVPTLPPGVVKLALLALLVAAGTLVAMWYPFDLTDRRGMWLTLARPEAAHVLLMIAAFGPMGLVEGWMARRLFRRHGVAMVMVMFDAALLSLISETAQMWLRGHDSSLIDLVANTLGGCAGAVVGDLLMAPRPPGGG